MSVVRLSGVDCAYNSERVLSGVSLDIAADDFVGVVGPSGSGKTTLLRVLLGSLKPVAGTVERQHGLRIGYVPQIQTINWNFPVTVSEVVLMARNTKRRLPWASPTEARQIASTLERLGIADLAHRQIRALSGGQQQRVFIARALINEPDLLLMDEPTSGVDVRTRHDVLHLLDELNHSGLAIVLSTHDLNEIAAHLPKIVCLNRRVIAAGAPADVLTPMVLEQTYGAPMEVLEHGGMRVIVDRFHPAHREPAP